MAIPLGNWPLTKAFILVSTVYHLRAQYVDIAWEDAGVNSDFKMGSAGGHIYEWWPSKTKRGRPR